MQRVRTNRGFTLVELLVVIGIIAILIAITLPVARMAITHANCAGCASHMHSLGEAFLLYANDHDSQLPGRAEGTGVDRWPVLLLPYVSGPIVYVDPGDPVATKVPLQNLASNNGNSSSFFVNGFNDLGHYTNPDLTVSLPNIAGAGPLMILGEKVNGSNQYYMDFVEGNEYDILNKQSYFGGSNYAFSDGSVQFIPLAQYSDTMWLVDKTYPITPQ